MLRSRLALAFGLLVVFGCTVNVPVDPTQWGDAVDQFVTRAQDQFAEMFRDPLGNHPYPWLIGGDADSIYYATDVGDIRINFAGRSNDLVMPGLLGPSNIYQIVDGQRQLLNPLLPTGTVTGLSTDGTWIVYVFVPDAINSGITRLVSAGVGPGVPERTLFETVPADVQLVRPDLLVNEGRVAFAVMAGADAILPEQLRVLDLRPTSPTAPVVIEADEIGGFDLRGNAFAYVARTASGVQLRLRDLADNSETLIATLESSNPGIASSVAVFLTPNKVVWSEPVVGAGLTRVRAHDLPTNTNYTWLDSVTGDLRGATDAYVVMEESTDTRAGVTRLAIRRYDSEGAVMLVADFRADGLAGQTRVVGDRILYVNPSRRIVTVSLMGAGRHAYAPY
jgi:hypothetical protein